MGTRHHQKVITKTGDLKISQYGQWDGYPSGQGIGILSYLRFGKLEEYQNNLQNIPLITKEQAEELDKTNDWNQKHPYLSRDCGSNIHQYIEDGAVTFVSHISDEDARKWCEGFYTIDFETRTFRTKYYSFDVSFSLDNLPTEEEYLEAFKAEQED